MVCISIFIHGTARGQKKFEENRPRKKFLKEFCPNFHVYRRKYAAPRACRRVSLVSRAALWLTLTTNQRAVSVWPESCLLECIVVSRDKDPWSGRDDPALRRHLQDKKLLLVLTKSFLVVFRQFSYIYNKNSIQKCLVRI